MQTGKGKVQVNPLQQINLNHVTVLEIEKGPPEWSVITVFLTGQTTRWTGEVAREILRAEGWLDGGGRLPRETEDALVLKQLEVARAVPHPTLLDQRKAQQEAEQNGGLPPRPLS